MTRLLYCTSLCMLATTRYEGLGYHPFTPVAGLSLKFERGLFPHGTRSPRRSCGRAGSGTKGAHAGGRPPCPPGRWRTSARHGAGAGPVRAPPPGWLRAPSLPPPPRRGAGPRGDPGQRHTLRGRCLRRNGPPCRRPDAEHRDNRRSERLPGMHKIRKLFLTPYSFIVSSE